MSQDFTIADVLAWARTKPADKAYDYGSNGNCALCQFLRETGRCATPSVGGRTWSDRSLWSGRASYPTFDIPDPIGTALIAETFGQLVSRLEKLAPERVVTPSEWTRLDAYMVDIESVSA